MTAGLAIELSDAGLLGMAAAGPLVGPSPGYALLEGRELRVGSEAEAHSRLKPRWVDHQFWDRLDSAPMPRPFPRSLTRADVVHAHLVHFWHRLQEVTGESPGTVSVLLAVPGSFTVKQLGLVLGIARAAGMPVTGLVDSAVAAMADRPVTARVLHLDVLLHRWVWSELVHDGQVKRRRVELLEGGALVRLRDAWARRAAELFVRQTRFDPFHHGSAEQALYDQLPQCLRELSRRGTATVVLQSPGEPRSVELVSEDIERVTGSLTAPVIESARSLIGSEESVVLALSERVCGIPGLVRELAGLIETPVVELDSGAVVEGALRHRQRIESPGSELPLVLQLPAELVGVPTGVDDRAAEVGSATTGAPVPTHILIGERAYRLTAQPLWLGSAIPPDVRGIQLVESMPGLSRMHCTVRRRDDRVVIEDHSRYGTYLNGVRIQQQAKAATGDRLRLGSPGIELLFILVAEEDV